MSSFYRMVKLSVFAVLAIACFGSQSMAAKPAVKSIQPKKDYVLRVVYFIPTNRDPVPEHMQKLQMYIKHIQKFYGMEMARNGFYKPGTTEGKTFAYEADKNGDVKINILKGKYDDAHYQGGCEQWAMVEEELSKAYDLRKGVWVVWTECCKIQPDQTITGPSCLGGAGEYPGGMGGVAVLGSDTFPFLDTKLWDDTRPVDGLIFPELGPYPLKHNVSYGGFAGNLVCNYASTIFGCEAHEVGHAFGMPHVFVNDYAGKIGGELMGCGNQGYRGNFGNYPGTYCHIFKANCEILNVNRAFNPDEPFTDKKAPKQTCNVVLENAGWEMGKNVHAIIKASDNQSGPYRAIAIMSPPWSTIASTAFNAQGVAVFDVNPSTNPYEGLKPNNYNLEFSAGDKQGNWSLSAHWIPVPKSLDIECFDGNDWRVLPSGCASPSDRLRVAVAIQGTDKAIKITPEAEVQPVGKPFTGKANFVGTAVDFSEKPVTGYVEFKLADGPYHWRYRLTDSKGKKSCWITPGSRESIGTDFVVQTTSH